MRYVISRKNLPSHPNITSWGVVMLLLDRFDAPGWMWGASGLLMLIYMVGWLVVLKEEKEVDVFEPLKAKSESKS